jgi:hypothetical protein
MLFAFFTVPPALFYFSYFSDRVSCFVPKSSSSYLLGSCNCRYALPHLDLDIHFLIYSLHFFNSMLSICKIFSSILSYLAYKINIHPNFKNSYYKTTVIKILWYCIVLVQGQTNRSMK